MTPTGGGGGVWREGKMGTRTSIVQPSHMSHMSHTHIHIHMQQIYYNQINNERNNKLHCEQHRKLTNRGLKS